MGLEKTVALVFKKVNSTGTVKLRNIRARVLS